VVPANQAFFTAHFASAASCFFGSFRCSSQRTLNRGPAELYYREIGRGVPVIIPEACTEHIAGAIPKARSVTLKECSHFSYLECPEQVRKVLDELFQPRAKLHRFSTPSG